MTTPEDRWATSLAWVAVGVLAFEVVLLVIILAVTGDWTP